MIFVELIIVAAFSSIPLIANDNSPGVQASPDIQASSSDNYTYYWIIGQLPSQTTLYLYAKNGASVSFGGTISSPVIKAIPAATFTSFNVGTLGYTQAGAEWYFLEMTSDNPIMVNFDRMVTIKTGPSKFEDVHGDRTLAKPPMELNTTHYFPNAGSGARDDILVMYSHERTNATVRRYTNNHQVFSKTVDFVGLYVSNYISDWLGPSSPDWDGYGLKVVAEKPIAAALFDELQWYPDPWGGSGYYFGFSGFTQLYDEYMHIHYAADYENYYILNPTVLTYQDEYENPIGSPRTFAGETSIPIPHYSIGYDTTTLPYLVHVKGTDVFAESTPTPVITDVRKSAAYMGWNSSLAQLGIYTSADTNIKIIDGRNGNIVQEFSMSAHTIFADQLNNVGFNENEPFIAVINSDVPVYQAIEVPIYYYIRQYPGEIGPQLNGLVADAGLDQEVDEGEEVQFDGSGSKISSESKLILGPNIRVDDATNRKGKWLPSIDVSNNDTIYVAWGDEREGNYDIYFARSIDEGQTFSSNIRVNDEEDGGQIYPSISADGNSIVYATWNHKSTNIYFAKSTDEGLSFNTSIRVNDIGINSSKGKSDIAVNRENKDIYVVWEDNKLNPGYWQPDIYFSKSTDGGQSFSNDILVSDIGQPNTQQDPEIAVDDTGTIYVVWEDSKFDPSPGFDICLSKSTDNGVSFSKSIRVNDDTGASHATPSIFVDKNGIIYVAWYQYRGTGIIDIHIAKSIDGGTSFGPSVRVNDEPHIQKGSIYSPPGIVASYDNIYVVWWDNRNSDFDIYLARSSDGGVSFGSDIRINDDTGTSYQSEPSIAIDSRGNIHVVWSDGRLSGYLDVYYAKGILTSEEPAEIVSYDWDLNNFVDSDNDGNFTNDVDATGPTPSHVYGDNGVYTVTLTVTDNSGSRAYDTMNVTVLNVDPIAVILEAGITTDIKLRIAGEKWHDATIYLYEDGIEIESATIVRYPGSPDGQSATFEDVYLDLTKEYSAKVIYTPGDDLVNGQLKGANPAWIILKFEDGSEERLHHTFNVNHEETWEWDVDLNRFLIGQDITFKASASDAGSDDLGFNWSFQGTTTWYNNDGTIGTSPTDPYPSPDGIFPFEAADVVKYVYTSRLVISLTVWDDDSGTATITITLA